jgi:hypothetical protein
LCAGTVGYTVVNTGELPIALGAAYELDRLTDDAWEAIPIPYMFRAWGRRLESGERYELQARVPEFTEPGHCRLRKRLRVDRDPHPGYEWLAREIEPIELTAEFEVIADGAWGPGGRG